MSNSDEFNYKPEKNTDQERMFEHTQKTLKVLTEICSKTIPLTVSVQSIATDKGLRLEYRFVFEE